MKTHSRLIFMLAALALVAAPAATAQLSAANVRAAQRPGSKLVDIDYDVTGVTAPVIVALEISADGGTTWSVPATSATGAVGNSVAPGTNLRITWNAGADWNLQVSTQTQFRVSVTDTPPISPGFSLIPAGTFTMGDTLGGDSDAPAHTVNVSSFYMAKNLVTKAEWDTVRTWALSNGYTGFAAGEGKASNHPVQTVSWFDGVKYCNARSQQEGLTPVYTVSGAVMKTGITVPTVDWTANGYRLPTEAEWEKAARGGLSGKRFPWGDTISHSQANYYAYSSYAYDLSGAVNNYHPTYATGSTPYTSPVGSFAANGYGLYDMAGNVFQWCWDWYGAYATGTPTDPRGVSSGSARVLRGGRWSSVADRSRSAFRYDDAPTYSVSSIGFRVARSSALAVTAVSPNITVDTRDYVTITLASLIDGSITGAGSYAPGSTATLTAVPASGYVFIAWTGDASGASNPLTLTMNVDRTIGATFSSDLADTDGDGLLDGAEVNTHGSSPLLADTDSDGLSDRAEVETHHSNPTLKDSDGDGFDDLFEVNTGFDPALGTNTPDALSSIRTAVEFRFNAASGVSYRIEDSTDLTQWDIIEPVIIGQSAVVTRFYSTENQPKRYFRVRRN